MNYMSDTMSVSTSWVKLANTRLILSFSFFTTDGAYEVKARMKGQSEFGDIIPGFASVAMQEQLECVELQVRSASGSINLSYFIKTQ